MSKTILIVDDEPLLIEFLQTALEANDYDVVTADNGAMGITTAKDKKPDIILMDAMMPQMNGIEACKAIRAEEEIKDIPIIMITAKEQEGDIQEGLDAGATEYITKPFQIKILFELIEKHTAGGESSD